MKLFSAQRPSKDDDHPVDQENKLHVAGRGSSFRSQVLLLMNVAIIACGVRLLWKRAAIKGINRYRKYPLRSDEQDIDFA